jgi:hypothetical protein
MGARDDAQQEFDVLGKRLGLVKRSGSWYRTGHEVISVLNLQRSQYGRRYYVNLAFWLTAFGEERFPKEHKCQIRIRLDEVEPDKKAEIERLLDLEEPLPGRRDALRQIFDSALMPFLDAGGTLAGLRQLYRDGRLIRAYISSRAVGTLRAA